MTTKKPFVPHTYDADLRTALRYMDFVEVRSGVFEYECGEETVAVLRSVGTDRALTLRSRFTYSYYLRRRSGRVLRDTRTDDVGALLLQFYGPTVGEALELPVSLFVPNYSTEAR